jgi:hypothetical protein
MDTLDLSVLTDDQIITLMRAAMREAAGRMPACQSAMREAMLDEAERARVAAAATEAEMAAIRARERQRIAEEAAAAVRAQHAEREAAIARQRQTAAADAARARQQQIDARTRAWLIKASALVDHPAADLSIVIADTRYGRRAMINRGDNRYTKDHLADFSLADGTIRTKPALVKRKADLAAFFGELTASNPSGTYHLCGSRCDWT